MKHDRFFKWEKQFFDSYQQIFKNTGRFLKPWPTILIVLCYIIPLAKRILFLLCDRYLGETHGMYPNRCTNRDCCLMLQLNIKTRLKLGMHLRRHLKLGLSRGRTYSSQPRLLLIIDFLTHDERLFVKWYFISVDEVLYREGQNNIGF